MDPALREPPAGYHPGTIVRATRKARGLTLAELGKRTGYSAAQMSRYERGITSLTDIAVLRRFAKALTIPPHVFGLARSPAPSPQRHGHLAAVTSASPWSTSSTVAGEREGEDGEVRRRQLLANLALTAAGTISAQAADPPPAPPSSTKLGDLFITRVRDAMLGLAPGPHRHFSGRATRPTRGRASRLPSLPVRPARRQAPPADLRRPSLAADDDTAQTSALLAATYTLATRMLIKLDDLDRRDLSARAVSLYPRKLGPTDGG